MSRIGISQPAIIQTQIIPPDSSFFIRKGGLTEQIYYENDDRIVPDRTVTPLVLTPVVEVYNPDTQVKSVATLNSASWYIGQTLITASNTDYVISGYTLIVRKNISTGSPVAINCVVTYLDPNDHSVVYEARDSITLNTILDADVIYPKLNVLAEDIQPYDPIIDGNNSLFTYQAQAILRGVDISEIVTFQWYGQQGKATTPFLINQTDTDGFGVTLGYSASNQPTGKGQGTDTIVIDAKYCDNFYIILRAKYIYTRVADTSNSNPHDSGWYERSITTVTSTTGKNPRQQGWYEYIEDIYVPTKDTTPQSGKTYYIITYTVTADTTPQEMKAYYTTNGALLPDKVYKMIRWEYPPMEIITTCDNGSQAGAENVEKRFGTIINIPHRVVSEEDKQKNLLFQWFSRRTNQSSATFRGWGKNITIMSDALHNTDGSNANVYCQVYAGGVNKKVTYGGTTVTYNGEPVTSRSYPEFEQ